jgi:hypothetical protein
MLPGDQPRCETGLKSDDGATMAMLFRFSPLSRLILVLWLGLGNVCAADSQPSEYQLKAAFLYHFAQFVEWPPNAFAETNSPMIIGIMGQNPFAGGLEQAVQGKTINNHPLTVKEIHSPAEATNNCHLLFISSSEKNRLPEIFAGMQGAAVLTVGETDHFTDAGGMINFVAQGNKIRFQINETATKKAGLKVSSKLLSLALRAAH